MNLRKYTLEQLKEAVQTSGSIRQALKKLGVAPYGGNYDVFRKAVENFDISTEHFHGQGWNKGDKSGILKRTRSPRTPMEDILKEGTSYVTSKLRLRLIKEGFKQHKCEICGLEEWASQPIPLELDHINGDRYDNRLENLRILCPNCHAQTDTYRGKNKGKYNYG